MTKIINFFAGPGSGKSSLASGLFSEMKWKDYNVELVTEFAKDLVWENREKTLNNQIYIFAKQYNRIWRLLDEVDYIIVDSPLMLGTIYRNKVDSITNNFEIFLLSVHNSLDNCNYIIDRRKPYKTKGRVQSESEAKRLDESIKRMLIKFNIPFKIIPGEKESIDIIMKEL